MWISHVCTLYQQMVIKQEKTGLAQELNLPLLHKQVWAENLTWLFNYYNFFFAICHVWIC